MIFIHWTWCFPQTLMGFVYLIYLTLRKKVSKKTKYELGTMKVTVKGPAWVSLGRYFFHSENLLYIERHEFGHCKQSLMLGPFYLLVIGLPSLIWNLLWTRTDLFSGNYYSFCTERWADKLGKVR